MGCSFCDVPKVGPGRNATEKDLIAQVLTCIRLHPEVQETNRLNVHFARMGEPSFNTAVIPAAYELEKILKYLNFKYHPVVSTMMPHNMYITSFISSWLNFKNDVMNGEAGLQLSINTTDEQARAKLFNNNSMTLNEISNLFSNVNGPIRSSLFNRYDESVVRLKGRKIALNFALTDAPIDAQLLRKLFDPRVFLCKITPMHLTASCVENSLETSSGYDSYYPYKKVEQELKDAGFDVIVFVPSVEEDMSKITCGNAILAEEV
jgi:23S rRNA (adenine2503-C2)-methyltransferase